jgi:hypothetical protein
MTAETATETTARPPFVTWAVCLILTKCVASVILAFSLFTLRDHTLRDWRTDRNHIGWSEDRLNHEFTQLIHQTIVVSIVLAVVTALVAKFIWDGKNWSRWLFAVLVILPIQPAGDVFKITSLFTTGPLAPRVLGFLVALLALASLAMTFTRPSAAYFRPGQVAAAGPRPTSPLANLLRPRVPPPAAPTRDRPPSRAERARKAEQAQQAKLGDRQAAKASESGANPPGTKRGAPRPKSRKAASE